MALTHGWMSSLIEIRQCGRECDSYTWLDVVMVTIAKGVRTCTTLPT